MTNPTEAPMANAIDDVKEWVLVPKEPTLEMINAGSQSRPYREDDGQNELTDRNTDMTWAAMLAAAPASPAPSHHTGWSDEAVERAAMIYHENWISPIREYRESWYSADLPEAHRVRVRNAARAALSAASSIAPATEMEMLLTREQVEVIDALDSALCQFLNNAGDEFDPREWLPSVQRDFGALSEAYSACHVAGIMDLRKARASISPSVAKERGEP